MKYPVIILVKLLMMAVYFILQACRFLWSGRLYKVSPKEMWFNAWKEFGYDPLVVPSPREAIFGRYDFGNWGFADAQAVYRGEINKHFL